MNCEAMTDRATERGGQPDRSPSLPLSVPPSPVSPAQVQDLVRAATLAPSPDNNQPWRFRFDDGKLLVYEDPARGLPSDVCSMFAMLALGAAVENVVIEATRHGLAAECRLSLRESDGNFRGAKGDDVESIAEILFSPGAQADRLADVLEKRCTNRHPYSREPVATSALNQIASAAERFDGCRLTWLVDRSLIRRVSKLVAVADRVRFERAEFHAELYRQLRFTPAEAERTRDGLDLRTLGLPPGGGLVMRLLKSWPLVRTLNHFGLSRALTAPSAVQVRNSGAVGVLTVANAAPRSFFAAGRAFERLWLTATDLGLSLHPVASLPIFVAHHELLGGRALDRQPATQHQPEAQARNSDATTSQAPCLSVPADGSLDPQPIPARRDKIQNPSRHARLAAALSREVRELLPAIAGQTLVMLFRLGTSKATPVRSLRRPVDEVFL
jgi:hypothetical protein